MRFFALAWAVLLPYYTLQQYLRPLPDLLSLVAEFLPTYSGILVVLTAEPLLREAASRGERIDGILQWINVVAGESLYLLILPPAIPFIPVGLGNQLMAVRVLDLLLAAVGFVFIGVVLRTLASGLWSRTLWWGLVSVAAVYFGYQIRWADDLRRSGSPVMRDEFAIAFALCKVLYSAMFLALVMSVPTCRNRDGGLSDQLLEIGRDCAMRLKEPFRSGDHADLLYDEKGLPK